MAAVFALELDSPLDDDLPEAYYVPLASPPEAYYVPQASPSARRRSSVYSRFTVGSVTSNLSITEYAVVPPPRHSRTSIDRFTPLTVLGQGAYGKVVLVRDRVSSKLYACKQFHKAGLMMGLAAARTVTEKEVLAQLTHPNIVQLHYALQDRDRVFLILEYVPGGELFRHLLMARIFTQDTAAFYTAEMALALHHLHGVGVVYRDLKPENCLLDSNGHLVLTDFGLLKVAATEPDHSCTLVIGTPEYMAPEVLRGEPYLFGVDWWLLGCVVYDMMSGNPPFTGNNHKQIADKITKAKNKLRFPPHFGPDTQDMLRRLLNRNVSKRWDVDGRWDEFQRHRFFRKVVWCELATATPPIVPTITDPLLAENFDPQFTGMRLSWGQDGAVDVPGTPSSLGDVFLGFSYSRSTA